MGARCLRSWLERPLREVAAITRRSNAVGALVNDTMGARSWSSPSPASATWSGSSAASSTARRAGATSSRCVIPSSSSPPCASSSRTSPRAGSASFRRSLTPLADIAARIAETIVDEPPFSVREGGFIRKGLQRRGRPPATFSPAAKGLLASIETKEKERTGIRTLKIGYNKVFGYYIEVSNSFKDQVPDTYIRKQTLVNGERYITQELKDLEQEILTAGSVTTRSNTRSSPPCATRSARAPSASRRPPPQSRSLTRSRRLPSSRSKTATAARWWTIPA